jgi:Na+-transporting methylmalonyl-CoA/oxaloacetate decarboxylase gamma subunit
MLLLCLGTEFLTVLLWLIILLVLVGIVSAYVEMKVQAARHREHTARLSIKIGCQSR